MNGHEKQKYVDNSAEFRGYVIAKLENFETFVGAFHKHTEDEMDELRRMNERLRKLENWKLQVSTLASAIGAVVGFTLTKLFS